MNSQNDLQLHEELQEKFLQDWAIKCKFFDNRKEVFMVRFKKSNASLRTNKLINLVEWNEKPADGNQTFQDNLKVIVDRLENEIKKLKEDFVVEKKGKRGRPKADKEHWKQVYRYLWSEIFPEWQAEQDRNAVSELDNRLPEEPDNLLPERFLVYVKGKNIISHPEPGYEEKVLPTVNKYYEKGKSGGYIACYSRNPKNSVCCVADGIYLLGQIWMPGRYMGRIFVPEKYEGIDISADAQLKQTCNVEFHQGGEDCWPGGDTGGWFEDAKGRIGIE